MPTIVHDAKQELISAAVLRNTPSDGFATFSRPPPVRSVSQDDIVLEVVSDREMLSADCQSEGDSLEPVGLRPLRCAGLEKT